MKSAISAKSFLDALGERGRWSFELREAESALGTSVVAVRAALRRLAGQGRLAVPVRGFYVVVPPEYRRLGCLPAEQFVPQLMRVWGAPYYAGLLTAAQFHGAAHQRPQVFQVFTDRRRPAIHCGAVRVQFIQRRDAATVPVEEFRGPRGPLRVSTAEATALDLIGHPQHAAGLDNVATILEELRSRLDEGRLMGVVPLSPLPWAQRLGYLLERDGTTRLDRLARWIQDTDGGHVLLAPDRPPAPDQWLPRWRLNVNTEIEIDD